MRFIFSCSSSYLTITSSADIMVEVRRVFPKASFRRHSSSWLDASTFMHARLHVTQEYTYVACIKLMKWPIFRRSTSQLGLQMPRWRHSCLSIRSWSYCLLHFRKLRQDGIMARPKSWPAFSHQCPRSPYLLSFMSCMCDEQEIALALCRYLYLEPRLNAAQVALTNHPQPV